MWSGYKSLFVDAYDSLHDLYFHTIRTIKFSAHVLVYTLVDYAKLGKNWLNVGDYIENMGQRIRISTELRQKQEVWKEKQNCSGSYIRNPPRTIQIRDKKLKENPLENVELLFSGLSNLNLVLTFKWYTRIDLL